MHLELLMANTFFVVITARTACFMDVIMVEPGNSLNTAILFGEYFMPLQKRHKVWL